MAHVIELQTVKDSRGSLTVIDKVLPFEMKRIFYIYDVPSGIVRGGHAHKKTRMALIAIKGSCTITVKTKDSGGDYFLTNPRQCLILEPSDYHWMKDFSSDGVLLVAASEHFDKEDYIFEEPK